MPVKNPVRKIRSCWQNVGFPVVVISLAVLIGLFDDSARELFRVDWTRIQGGEIWRLWTGHLAHLGWSHLILNALGLALVWMLVGDRYTQSQWWLLACASALGISVALEFISRDIGWYVGLSGVLHALLTAGIVRSIRDRPLETGILGVAVAAKLVWEQLHGSLPGSVESAGGPVIVDAHLFGALIGIFLALLIGLWERRSRQV